MRVSFLSPLPFQPMRIRKRKRQKANVELVLDARRYFKQSEIVLYRQAPEGMALAQEHNKQIQQS
jgi:hypothetical protein